MTFLLVDVAMHYVYPLEFTRLYASSEGCERHVIFGLSKGIGVSHKIILMKEYDLYENSLSRKSAKVEFYFACRILRAHRFAFNWDLKFATFPQCVAGRCDFPKR